MIPDDGHGSRRSVILRLLAVWDANPALRLGQLIGNTYNLHERGGNTLYYRRDEDLITDLESFYGNS